VFTKLLSVAAVFFATAGAGSAQDRPATKFTVRIENITKADAFTAGNGAKWSLGFPPVRNAKDVEFGSDHADVSRDAMALSRYQK
jgi:hypothetical protein